MNQQILSQDEVDALLQGITGESQKLDEPEAPAGGVRNYDLASQERIVRGRMPTMEIINERFARNVRVGLFNLHAQEPRGVDRRHQGAEVSATSCARSSCRPTSTSCQRAAAARLRADRVCDPTLVFAVIDASSAASGKYHTRIEGRDFSPTELRVIQRLVE